MTLPPRLHAAHGVDALNDAFRSVPVVLIGAHAVAAYAPERMTHDVDYLTSSETYEHVRTALRAAGFVEHRPLRFPSTRLGRYGSSWSPPDGPVQIDLISSDQPWAAEAMRAPVVTNASGDRVIPLGYLVLMKIDAARTIDQGDLSRMLGRLTAREVESIVALIARHYAWDLDALDDIRQYAEIGRWEYEQT